MAYIKPCIYEEGCGHRLTEKKTEGESKREWDRRGGGGEEEGDGERSGGSTLAHEFHPFPPKIKRSNKCRGKRGRNQENLQPSIGRLAQLIKSITPPPPQSPPTVSSRLCFTNSQFTPLPPSTDAQPLPANLRYRHFTARKKPPPPAHPPPPHLSQGGGGFEGQRLW